METLHEVTPSQTHRTQIQNVQYEKAQGACTLARPSLKE